MPDKEAKLTHHEVIKAANPSLAGDIASTLADEEAEGRLSAGLARGHAARGRLGQGGGGARPAG